MRFKQLRITAYRICFIQKAIERKKYDEILTIITGIEKSEQTVVVYYYIVETVYSRIPNELDKFLAGDSLVVLINY